MHRLLWSVLVLLGFFVGLYSLFRWLLPFLWPFIIGAILAEILAPAVDFLVRARRLRLSRGLATAVVVLLAAGVLATLATLGVARLIGEARAIAGALPDYYFALQELVSRATAQLGAISATLPGPVREVLDQALDGSQGKLDELLASGPQYLMALLTLPSLAAEIGIMSIATFFILRDRRAIGRFFINFVPVAWHPKLREAKAVAWKSAVGVAKAVTILVTITGVLTMIGLAVIGVPYAISIGLLVAMVDILPILGPAIVFVPWIAYQLALGQTLFAVKLLILYAVLLAVRQVLEPQLIGEQAGLHPLAILFSIYVGFQFFGVAGFLFGPIAAIILRAVVQSHLLPIFAGNED